MIRRLILKISEHYIFTRYPSTKQFVKFSFVGVFVTLIDFSIYFTLTRLFLWWEEHFLYANGAAFLTALSVSFFVNKLWAFRNNHKSYRKQYTKFFISNLVALLISQLILYYLVSILSIGDIFAKPIAVAIIVLFNFFSYKFWVFKHKDLIS